MPRGRTVKIHEVKRKILQRVREGFYRAGDRFMSARIVAERYEISYQTAHRMLSELCKEGFLERRGQSGTYIPGKSGPLAGVLLVFHRRAQEPRSFGQKLLNMMTAKLKAEGIDYVLRWYESPQTPLEENRLTVVWEAPHVLQRCVEQKRPALLLNDRPSPGIGAMFIDSVSTDDFGGGVCAGELMKQQLGAAVTGGGFAVLAGPTDDMRSRLRADGFRSIIPATVCFAGDWFFEQGYAAAPQAVEHGKSGIFCCNDNLAAAVLRWCEDQKVKCPPIIGFDDAPIAEKLNLTTISVPWDEIVVASVGTVRRRLGGDRSASSRQVFHPRPVIRGVGSAGV